RGPRAPAPRRGGRGRGKPYPPALPRRAPRLVMAVGDSSLGAESTVRRTVLPGGLRVVTEFLPAVRSVALGIWVGVGSRDEDEAHAGATHYLEHLLFKGT